MYCLPASPMTILCKTVVLYQNWDIDINTVKIQNISVTANVPHDLLL